MPSRGTLPDDDAIRRLIHRIRAAAEDAQDAKDAEAVLVRELLEPAYLSFRQRGVPHTDAEDLASQALVLTLLAAREPAVPEDVFRYYFLGVLRTLARSYFSRRRPSVVATSDLEHVPDLRSDQSGLWRLARDELLVLDQLMRAAHLSGYERWLVALRMQGFSYGEILVRKYRHEKFWADLPLFCPLDSIAEITTRAVAAIRATVKRALDKLKAAREQIEQAP